MKVTKTGQGNDLFDIVAEEKYHKMVEISEQKFDQARLTELIDGVRVVRVIESENFGYVVDENGKIYRC